MGWEMDQKYLTSVSAETLLKRTENIDAQESRLSFFASINVNMPLMLLVFI